MTKVTSLGDPAVTITLAAVILVVLMRSSPAVALQWLEAVAACGLITSIAKLNLYLYGRPIPGIQLRSPSGHVSASILVYGIVVLAVCDGPRSRMLFGCLFGLTISLIALSRVYLHAHSGADVVVGTAIGAACLAWIAPKCARQEATASLRLGALASLAICVTGAVMGWQLPIDRALRALAAYMSDAVS